MLVGDGVDVLGNMVGGLLGCHIEVQMGEPITGWFGVRVDGESPEIHLLISVSYKDELALVVDFAFLLVKSHFTSRCTEFAC